MADFGQAKAEWFQTFLELPNGIPAHDTFWRVFEALNPEQFQHCFLQWIAEVRQRIAREVIAVDGKTLRRSYAKEADKAAIHRVSAWATTNRLVLGQQKVDAKSNEITAIPELLRGLDIQNCIVTIDATGCQTAIAHLKAIRAICTTMWCCSLMIWSTATSRLMPMTMHAPLIRIMVGSKCDTAGPLLTPA